MSLSYFEIYPYLQYILNPILGFVMGFVVWGLLWLLRKVKSKPEANLSDNKVPNSKR